MQLLLKLCQPNIRFFERISNRLTDCHTLPSSPSGFERSLAEFTVKWRCEYRAVRYVFPNTLPLYAHRFFYRLLKRHGLSGGPGGFKRSFAHFGV